MPKVSASRVVEDRVRLAAGLVAKIGEPASEPVRANRFKTIFSYLLEQAL
jgi:hypothetical protein